MPASNLHPSSNGSGLVQNVTALRDAPNVPGVYAVSVDGTTKFGRSRRLGLRLRSYALATTSAEKPCGIFFVPTEADLLLEKFVLKEAVDRNLPQVDGTRECFACDEETAKSILHHVSETHRVSLDMVSNALAMHGVKTETKPLRGSIIVRKGRFRASFFRRGIRKSATFETKEQAIEWLETIYQEFIAKKSKRVLRTSSNDMESIDAALTALVGEDRANAYRRYIRAKKS